MARPWQRLQKGTSARSNDNTGLGAVAASSHAPDSHTLAVTIPPCAAGRRAACPTAAAFVSSSAQHLLSGTVLHNHSAHAHAMLAANPALVVWGGAPTNREYLMKTNTNSKIEAATMWHLDAAHSRCRHRRRRQRSRRQTTQKMPDRQGRKIGRSTRQAHTHIPTHARGYVNHSRSSSAFPNHR